MANPSLLNPEMLNELRRLAAEAYESGTGISDKESLEIFRLAASYGIPQERVPDILEAAFKGQGDFDRNTIAQALGGIDFAGRPGGERLVTSAVKDPTKAFYIDNMAFETADARDAYLNALQALPQYQSGVSNVDGAGGGGGGGGGGGDTSNPIETGYLEGNLGYDFAGENTGLREPYVPFVGQMLGRVSALMAARNAPGYKPMEFGVNYGQDTASELKRLKNLRETTKFTPYNFSFAPGAPKSYASGGIASLVSPEDKYQTGAIVGGSGVNTVSGGESGNPSLPKSMFTEPTGYTPTTFTSGYTAPTNIYTAGTLTSTYDKPDPYQASTVSTGTFDAAARDRLMNPYMSGVTDPAVREAKRQAALMMQAQNAKFAQSGAFGGTGRLLGEQAIGRNLATQVGDIYGKGQKEAYESALKAFEAEQGRGIEAERIKEQSKQFGANLEARAAEIAATLGLDAAKATELAKQEAGRQSLSTAETAARLGLDAAKATEQSKQYGSTFGLDVARTSADFQQRANDLQQRAEEAAARGDQEAARLAFEQAREAARSAEAQRTFEYQQQRDMYLDPFREAGYMSQILGGLPSSASATGVSPNMEAIAAMLGLGTVLKPSDRRLKTDIQTIGVLSDGLKVYSYRYKSGGPMQIGVMADEVAILRPQAYIKGGAGDGFDAVDYAKL